MLIKGFVEVRIWDGETGEIRQIVKKQNIIPENTLVDMLFWQPNTGYLGNKQIAISDQTTTPNPNVYTVNGIIGVGYVATGISSPEWYDSVTPPFGQIHNRFDPPGGGVPRTFQTIALVDNLAPGDQAEVSATAYAYVLMDIPCVQQGTDYIDIYYRIQFQNPSNKGFTNTKRATIDFGSQLFGKSPLNAQGGFGFRAHIGYSSFVKPPTASYTDLFAAGCYIAAYQGVSGNPLGWISGQAIASHFKWKMTFSQSRDNFVGIIFNTILLGQSDTDEAAYSFAGFGYDKEPYQNGFWHSSASTLPFYDTGKTGGSNGKITLSGTWTGGFPCLFKITITTGGAVGTSQYKFSVRRHLGFDGNSYTDTTHTGCPFRNPNVASAAGMHGYKEENNDVLRFSNTQIVQYDASGVTLLDVVTGAYTNYDAGTAIAIGAAGSSNFRQVATDGSKIYCGCTNTGLWVIDTVAGTSSNPVSTPCYGVDVGKGGTIWGIFEGSLRRSTDWTASVTFAYTGITDNNWKKVKYLKVDPGQTDNQLAIVYDTGAGNGVCWYKETGAIASTGPTGIKSYPAGLDVSDTGGFWAINQFALTFGSTTTTQLPDLIPTKDINSSNFGQDTFYKVSFYKTGLICTSNLVAKDATIMNSYAQLPGGSYFTHINGGITLGARFLRQLFTDNSYCWDNYGWTGAAWSTASTGTRATSTTANTLVLGVRAAFANAASGTSFKATDYFTEGVCYGLWKDNATDVYFEGQWYTKPVNFNTQIPSGVTASSTPYTLPAVSDANFVRIETDGINSLAKFQLAGVTVANVYTDGTAPGPGEISIDGIYGTVTFNSADAGKAFTGYYAWIRYA